MARRRTSNATKKAQGNTRPGRMRTEPVFSSATTVPDPPAWLDEEYGVPEWEARAHDLVANGIATHANLLALAHWAQTHADMVRTYLEGEPVSAAVLGQFRLMCTEFGFTPASHSKAMDGLQPKAPENEFEQFKGRKARGA